MSDTHTAHSSARPLVHPRAFSHGRTTHHGKHAPSLTGLSYLMRRALAGAATALAHHHARVAFSAEAAPAARAVAAPFAASPPSTSAAGDRGRGRERAGMPRYPRRSSDREPRHDGRGSSSSSIRAPRRPQRGHAASLDPHAAPPTTSPTAARLYRGLLAALEAGADPPPLPDGTDPLRSFLISRRMEAAPSADGARDLLGLAYAAGTLPDPRHFTLLASRYGSEARPEAVRATMASAALLGFKERPQWFSSLIAAHGRRRDLTGARAAHREMDALFGADERSVCALLAALGASGRAAEAVETVAALRARRAAAARRADEDNSRVGLGGGGRHAAPPRPASPLAPLSLATYTALLLAHVEARDVPGARATLAAAAADGVSLDGHVRPQQALLRLWVRAGDERRARTALAAMGAAGAPPASMEHAWALLADLAGTRGGPDAVHGVLAEADAAGVAPYTACYTVLLNARAAAGDVLGAGAVAAEMRARSVPLSRFTYGSLIRWHARRGDLAGAEAAHRAQAADAVAGTDPVSDAALVDAGCQAWWNGGRTRPALLDAAWETALRLRVVDPGRLFKRPRWPGAVEHPWAVAGAWRGGGGGERGGVWGAAAPPAPPSPSPPPPPGARAAPFIEVDLHHMSPWTAQLALLAALDRLLVAGWRGGRSFVDGAGRSSSRRSGHRNPASFPTPTPPPTPPPTPLPPTPPPAIHIITGIGRRSRAKLTSGVRHAVIRLLHNLGLPVRLGPTNEGVVMLGAKDLASLFAGCDGSGPGPVGGRGVTRRRLLPTHCGDVLVEAPL